MLEKLEVDTAEQNWEYKIKKVKQVAQAQASQTILYLKFTPIPGINLKPHIKQLIEMSESSSLSFFILIQHKFFVNKKLGFFLVFLFDIRIYNMENLKKEKSFLHK